MLKPSLALVIAMLLSACAAKTTTPHNPRLPAESITPQPLPPAAPAAPASSNMVALYRQASCADAVRATVGQQMVRNAGMLPTANLPPMEDISEAPATSCVAGATRQLLDGRYETVYYRESDDTLFVEHRGGLLDQRVWYQLERIKP